MDIENVFLSCYSIQKKPKDIFALIQLALYVGAFKYPAQFEKRKDRILKFLMNPTISNFYDDDMILSDEEDDEIIDNVGDEEKDKVINVEQEKESEKEKQCVEGTQLIHTESKNNIIATNQIPIRKIKVIIKKPEQVAPQMKQNNCNAITGTTESVTELKKRSETDLVQYDKLWDGNNEGTGESDNTTMGPRKKMSVKKNVSTKHVEVAATREKQLVGDCSAQKMIEEAKQTTEKQSHKGFKKMETNRVQNKKLVDTEKKSEGAQQNPTQRRTDNMMGSAARKECTSGLTKSMPPPLMKMNVATKRVEVAPPNHHKQLQKQNCSAITRPVQKTTQSSAATKPTQKETVSITDMKRFESSKRKFEERVAEQREAKRRIIMVDIHHVPKPANDPRAPRRCWERRRF